MRPLRYSINVTLDGCCDHRAIVPDEDLHRHHAENLARADALLFGRVTYEMMEAAWRQPAPAGARPEWMEPFARTIDAAKKYVVSRTLDRVDWNAERVRGDLGEAVQRLNQESGRGLLVGGVTLPLALAELGLIDEYEFVVQPRVAGHGPTLFAGLSRRAGWAGDAGGGAAAGPGRGRRADACPPPRGRRADAAPTPAERAMLRAWPTGSPMTVQDVLAGGSERYVQRVRDWARAVTTALDAAEPER